MYLVPAHSLYRNNPTLFILYLLYQWCSMNPTHKGELMSKHMHVQHTAQKDCLKSL